MHLKADVFDRIIERLVDAGYTERHQQQARALYESVYEITPSNVERKLQKLFNSAMQERSNPLTMDEYAQLAHDFEPDGFASFSSHQEAFTYLLSLDNIGQKIANEFLRNVSTSLNSIPPGLMNSTFLWTRTSSTLSSKQGLLNSKTRHGPEIQQGS